MSATRVRITVAAEDFFREVDDIKGFVNDNTIDMNQKISTQEAYLQAVKARAEIAALEIKTKAKDAEQDVINVHHRALTTARHVEHIVRSMYNIVMRVLDFCGIVIDATFKAFIQFAFHIVSIVIKIAIAKTMTVWLAAEAATSFTAAAMVFVEAMNAEGERNRTRAEMTNLRQNNHMVIGL